MKKSHLLGAVCACAITFVSLSANAALVSRLGGLAYYDDVADLTWLADANAAGTTMNWPDANAWAAGLDVAGVTGWRLPDTIDVGNDGVTYTTTYEGVDYGYNITTHSEMSNMFYNVLGNTGSYDTSGTPTGCAGPNYCLTNTGPFSNIQSYPYWSSTEHAPDTLDAWFFDFYNGWQSVGNKVKSYNAWAVHTGDASLVPIPASVWLFGSGLLGLVGVARRKKEPLQPST